MRNLVVFHRDGYGNREWVGCALTRHDADDVYDRFRVNRDIARRAMEIDARTEPHRRWWDRSYWRALDWQVTR